jgi:hypothetical protein
MTNASKFFGEGVYPSMIYTHFLPNARTQAGLIFAVPTLCYEALQPLGFNGLNQIP